MVAEEQGQMKAAAVFHPDPGRLAEMWCPSCGEEFSEEFVCCPFDGAPLVTSGAKRYFPLPAPACANTDTGGRAPARRVGRPATEYRLTTLENRNLLARLVGLACDAAPGLRGKERPRDGFLRLEPPPAREGACGRRCAAGGRASKLRPDGDRAKRTPQKVTLGAGRRGACHVRGEADRGAVTVARRRGRGGERDGTEACRTARG